MRVLVVAPSLHTRGGITSVVRLHMETNAWREMNCTHLSTHDDRSAMRKMWAAIRSYAQAPFQVAQVDIVHLHMAGELSLLRKLPIAAMARLLRKPYIAHIHASGTDSLFERTPRWATRFVLENATRTVALSSSWADAIRQQVPGARVEVLPNPVRLFPARKAGGQTAVLFAGKLEARKGYRTLLEAAPAVLKEHPHARFVFAGHGEMDEAKGIAQALGISSSVEILGWVSQVEMDLLYNNATVFCLPSSNEGMPMSVLEAMSHGVPVVCTPVGGLPEIIVDGWNGILTKVDDAVALAAGILRVLNNSANAAAMGAAARETVGDLCSLEQVDKRLSNLYGETISRHVSAGTGLKRVL